jgi:microcystin-dependent protein
MPAHTHPAQASSSAGDTPDPGGHVLAGANNLYGPADDLTTLLPATISNVGGSQPHENRSPYLGMNWIVALTGVFPSRN